MHTKSSLRDPRDAISQDLFYWLGTRVKRCEAILVFVDKFLAHSATPESRATITNEQTDVTLGQILDAHKTLCQIAEFISQSMFLCSIGSPLPTATFDQFEHFEKPWATEETIQKLREWWHGYYGSTYDWLKWDWQNEYAAYCASGAD